MKYLLQSDHLQCRSENELHLLLCVWNRENGVLNGLPQHLRFEHMDAHYVGHMLAYCPTMKKAGVLPAALSRALSGRDVGPALLEAQGIVLRANRGLPPGEAEWAFDVFLPRNAVQNAVGDECLRCLGLAAGYPMGFCACSGSRFLENGRHSASSSVWNAGWER